MKSMYNSNKEIQLCKVPLRQECRSDQAEESQMEF